MTTGGAFLVVELVVCRCCQELHVLTESPTTVTTIHDACEAIGKRKEKVSNDQM